jgi:RNA polymerase-binding transcription factor DksA
VDTSTARDRLQQLLADLDSSADALLAEHAGDTSELSHFDQHPADTATDISDLEREGALLNAVNEQRDQVRAALARVDAGTYGRCVNCGNEIPDERLDARPEAAYCLPCQTKMEAAR